ncbi:hypothetical protein MMC10_005958 [Thelotrema lepadinum]|nr:hypothetical protein [Thelotrema lepadinum]
MDPAEQNYYYSQSQSQSPYTTATTSSAGGIPPYTQPLPPHIQTCYQQPPSIYGTSMPIGGSMPPIPTGYDPVAPLQPYQESRIEYPTEFELRPESEEAIQRERRKESNRLAQRRFRAQNKVKIQELQEKLGGLQQEVKGLKDDNDTLRRQQEELEEKIQELIKDNERLKSSPVSPESDSYWQFGQSDDFQDPSRSTRGGSSPSYTGSHHSY